MPFKWYEAFLIVRFDEITGQEVLCLYPPTHTLTSSMLTDIKMLSMPECLEAFPNQSNKYIFRIRDKEPGGGNECLLCYVTFIRVRDNRQARNYLNLSLILVSRHTFITLHNAVLTRMMQTISKIQSVTRTSVEEKETKETKKEKEEGELYTCLETAYHQITQWRLSEGNDQEYDFPLLGTVIHFERPCTAAYLNVEKVGCSGAFGKILLAAGAGDGDGQHKPNEPENAQRSLEFLQHMEHTISQDYYSYYSTFIRTSQGHFSDLNIALVYFRLGLLDHLWTLWGLLMSGKRIFVYSTNAGIVSKVVAVLCNLCAPLGYGGDFRPYIGMNDDDVNLFTQGMKKNVHSTPTVTPSSTCAPTGNCDKDGKGKQEEGSSFYHETVTGHGCNASDTSADMAVLLGITNAFLVRNLSHFDGCLYLPNPDAALSGGSEEASYFEGDKLYTILGIGSSHVGQKSEKRKSSGDVNTRLVVMKEKETFEGCYDDWLVMNTSSDNDSHTGFLCVKEVPLVEPDEQVLSQVKGILQEMGTGDGDDENDDGNGSGDGSGGDWNQEEEISSEAVVADMLLKEHFRGLSAVVYRSLLPLISKCLESSVLSSTASHRSHDGEVGNVSAEVRWQRLQYSIQGMLSLLYDVDVIRRVVLDYALTSQQAAPHGHSPSFSREVIPSTIRHLFVITNHTWLGGLRLSMAMMTSNIGTQEQTNTIHVNKEVDTLKGHSFFCEVAKSSHFKAFVHYYVAQVALYREIELGLFK